MALYSDEHIIIYFGDSSDQLGVSSTVYDQYHTQKQLIAIKPFNSLQAELEINHLVFPRQVHGKQGIVIDNSTLHAINPFEVDGDYIVTNIPHIGLGILTADCLPIILYDTQNHVITAIHAGWRSSVQKIVVHALQRMHNLYETKPINVRVFFGPCARACCYSVGPDMIQAVAPHQDQVFRIENNQRYLDLIEYNKLLLESEGVPSDSFCSDYAQCTICDSAFWSYRRQHNRAGRQMTVVALKQSSSV